MLDLINKVIRESNDPEWTFEAEVPIELYLETDREYTQLDTKLDIRFQLIPEIRQSGIKDIEVVLLTQNIEIAVEFDTGIQRISVSLSDAQIVWMQGRRFTLGGITIAMQETANGLELTEEPEVTAYYLVP